MFAKSKLVADRLIKARKPAPEAEPADPPTPLFEEQQAAIKPANARRPASEAEASPSPAPLLAPLQAQVNPSVISDAVIFVGNLISKGAIHIDGSARGTVEADAVTVGAAGSLDGKVSCRKLHVKGNLSGSAVCDDLIIDDAANVTASLTYKTLLVQRGAQVNGELFVTEGA